MEEIKTLLVDGKTLKGYLPEGLAVTGDNGSECITFTMSKVINGIDISKKNIYVCYRNANGDSYVCDCINAKTTGDEITFQWYITKEATNYAGKVFFHLEISDGTYMWRSFESSFSVFECKVADVAESVEYEPNWLDTINETIATAKTEITAIQQSAANSETAAKASETAAANSATAAAESAELAKETLENKVDKVEGKELSSNDYTDADKTKLAQLDAEVATLVAEKENNLNAYVSRYYAMARTSDIATIEILDSDVTNSTLVERYGCIAGKKCEPSTDTYAGVDEIGEMAMWKPTYVNWELDENGKQIITAIEGMSSYKDEGKVNVGVMNMGLYVKEERNEANNGKLVHFSMLPRESEGYKPRKEMVDIDGNIQEFMLHPASTAVDIDGVPYGSFGKVPKRSATSFAAYAYPRKQGAAYSFETDMDANWVQVLTMVKYGDRNIQKYMQGCTSYSGQYQAEVAEDNTNRIILSKAHAEYFVVGSVVCVGGNATKAPDRGSSAAYNIIDNVKVVKIQAVDDTHSAVVLDTDATLSVPVGAWISTMPWESGATRSVLGYDGSPTSNTNAKCPCKINGIEILTGGYSICGNSMMSITTDSDGNTTAEVWHTNDVRKITSTAEATLKAQMTKVGDIPITNGNWAYPKSMSTDFINGTTIPAEYGGSTSTYYADGWHTGSNPKSGVTELRELAFRGALTDGASCGGFYVCANNALSASYWYCLPTLSPNAVRGE
jgi:hypothetical protein